MRAKRGAKLLRGSYELDIVLYKAIDAVVNRFFVRSQVRSHTEYDMAKASIARE